MKVSVALVYYRSICVVMHCPHTEQIYAVIS